MNGTREHEEHEVVSWRRDQLARAGFALSEAWLIAQDARYDLHELVDLVRRGCDPALAMRILAPLEERAA